MHIWLFFGVRARTHTHLLVMAVQIFSPFVRLFTYVANVLLVAYQRHVVIPIIFPAECLIAISAVLTPYASFSCVDANKFQLWMLYYMLHKCKRL